MSVSNEQKKSGFAGGIITEVGVKRLREILYVDGAIDKEGAELLFDLNDIVSGKKHHKCWQTFFVDAITSFLLEDEMSPGEIDDDEAQWLLSKIQGAGKLNELVAALLANLKVKAKSFPEILDLK
jgi:hypothetical protein